MPAICTPREISPRQRKALEGISSPEADITGHMCHGLKYNSTVVKVVLTSEGSGRDEAVKHVWLHRLDYSRLEI